VSCLSNNFNLTDEQARRLLNLAGEKLGTDPDRLRSRLEQGSLDGVLGRLDEEKKARLNSLLADPEALKQTLASPAVRAMLKNLLGN